MSVISHLPSAGLQVIAEITSLLLSPNVIISGNSKPSQTGLKIRCPSSESRETEVSDLVLQGKKN